MSEVQLLLYTPYKCNRFLVQHILSVTYVPHLCALSVLKIDAD